MWAKMIGRDRTALIANSAAAAHELSAERSFDLAIIDLRLGGESGLELLRELKRDQTSAVFVLYSGYLSVEVAAAAARAGADLVVCKPITFREILRKLEQPEGLPSLDETPTLARAEWEHIMRVLSDCNGNITIAARRLGIYRSSLQRRLKKFAPHR